MSHRPQPQLQIAQTQRPYQHPQQSLRVISNYSSLERMCQKVTSPRKVYLQPMIVKKESIQIGRWGSRDGISNKEKGKEVGKGEKGEKEREGRRKRRQQFRTVQNRMHTNNTITLVTVSDKTRQTQRSITHKITPSTHKSILQTTNFKLKTHQPRSNRSHATTHTPSPSLQPLSSPHLKTYSPIRDLSPNQYKTILISQYQKSLSSRRSPYYNHIIFDDPEIIGTITEYPLLDREERSRRGRERKKREFFRHFGI